ncbi:PadR family transcriptional regulator [Micromonospora yasonensis]|uniref:PadR family transcriptional regulator n=1 Tax=Micromonospora yasonensis TaxID=1128667 RepID=UPI00222FD5E8|nr:PadR family transcriptional regulator [Micromonospora yasonensis]MCW3838920.1 PadR family transcriptional regulator [Micromonospora yasonensis]
MIREDYAIALGLLAVKPMHGYDLRNAFQALFPDDKPPAYGQLYRIIARLAKMKALASQTIGRDQGPDRLQYKATEEGRSMLDKWLNMPFVPQDDMASLPKRIVLGLHCGKPTSWALGRIDEAEEIVLQRSNELKADLGSSFRVFQNRALVQWLEFSRLHLDGSS